MEETRLVPRQDQEDTTLARWHNVERVTKAESAAAFLAMSNASKNAWTAAILLTASQYVLCIGHVIITIPVLMGLALAAILLWPSAACSRHTRRIGEAMRFGVPVRGKIVGIRGNGRENHPHKFPKPSTKFRLVVKYRGPDGKEHKVFEYLPWANKGPLPFKIGDEVTVLVDPRRPDCGALPLLHTGGEPRAPQDGRKRLDAVPAPALLTDGGASTFQLFDEAPGKREARTVGSIAVVDETLVYEGPSSGERCELPLDKPFSLGLTTWLVSDDQAAVNVEVRPRGASVKARVASFTVHLPQSGVDARVPLKQAYLPVMEASAFERLWPMLKSRAAVHGETGWDLIHLLEGEA